MEAIGAVIPMGPLANHRHEKFVLLIVGGARNREAYQQAGYKVKPRSADSCAAALLAQPSIVQRIAELKQQVADLSVMSQIEVLQELSKLGRANMRHFMKVGTDGQPTLDWRDLTPEQTAAIQEVTVEEFVDGRSDKREVRRVKFKLAPKTNALELLGKHHGSFVERVEVKHQHTVLHTLLREIDAESRDIVTIEHDAGEVAPGRPMDILDDLG